MYQFHCTKDFKKAGVEMLEGRDYYVEDVNAGEFICYDVGKVNSGFDPNAERVGDRAKREARMIEGGLLLVRPGGFGDLLFLTAVIRAIRSKYPTMRIGVCAFQRFLPVLDGIDVEQIAYPLWREELGNWGDVAWMEGAVEKESFARDFHITQALAQRLPFALQIEDRALDYRMTEDEALGAIGRYPRNDRPRIGVQLSSSAASRNYPGPHLSLLVDLLRRDECEVFLFGHPGEFPQPSPHETVVNLTLADPALSMRESVAVLDTCDVVVAPDSSMAHFAAALGRPCVALYASFPWQLRTGPYKTTRALTGNAPCAPCFHHVRAGQHWPEDKICNQAGYCVAMGNIQPARVVSEVKKMLKEVRA